MHLAILSTRRRARRSLSTQISQLQCLEKYTNKLRSWLGVSCGLVFSIRTYCTFTLVARTFVFDFCYLKFFLSFTSLKHISFHSFFWISYKLFLTCSACAQMCFKAQESNGTNSFINNNINVINCCYEKCTASLCLVPCCSTDMKKS